MRTELIESAVLGAPVWGAYPGLAEVKGFAIVPLRSMLNRLCSFRPTNYLEVGVYAGATLAAAAAGNEGNFTGIDNLKVFKVCDCVTGADISLTPVERRASIDSVCATYGARFVEADMFTLPPDLLREQPLDVFFYDGDHGQEPTRRALTHFAPSYAAEVTLVVDDLDRREEGTVAEGINQGLRDLHALGYQVVRGWALHTPYSQGVFAAHLRRT